MGQNLDWFGFWGQAVAAAIGALAAFLFALWQSRLQNERERRARQLEKREIDVLALKAAIDACSINIEELVNYKSQTLESLSDEASLMRELLERNAPIEEIAALAGGLPNFFQELPRGSFASIPTSDNFAFAIDDTPAITRYVHRASSSPNDLSAAVVVRNELTRRWAEVHRIGASGNDIRYFFSMLTSCAEAIVSHADDAIFFSTLLHDQCYLLGLEKFERPGFRCFHLAEEKLRFLVPDDYFSGYRDQLVTFGRQIPARSRELAGAVPSQK